MSSQFKIGVRLEAMGLPIRKALKQAPHLGVEGVMFDAIGDLGPENLTATGQRELKNILNSENLKLIAVGCPLRKSLDTLENQQERLEMIRDVMTLSAQLGSRVVVIQAGKIPTDFDSAQGFVITETLQTLARHGDHIGSILALETGLESGESLGTFLDRFDTGSLAVNLDPANLLLHGFDIYESMQALKGRIVHTDVHDAKVASASRAKEEVPIGHGDIDWMYYLSYLAALGYHGWLTLERESVPEQDRLQEIAQGVSFLRRFMP